MLRPARCLRSSGESLDTDKLGGNHCCLAGPSAPKYKERRQPALAEVLRGKRQQRSGPRGQRRARQPQAGASECMSQEPQPFGSTRAARKFKPLCTRVLAFNLARHRHAHLARLRIMMEARRKTPLHSRERSQRGIVAHHLAAKTAASFFFFIIGGFDRGAAGRYPPLRASGSVGTTPCFLFFGPIAMASAMKDLSASRRSSVNELCSFVGATQVESIALLSKFNWNVAVRMFLCFAFKNLVRAHMKHHPSTLSEQCRHHPWGTSVQLAWLLTKGCSFSPTYR